MSTPNSKPINPPSRVTVRVDANGITAVNGRGYSLQIAASPSTEGFNALELQSAALGICTALNLRRELKAETGEVPPYELQVNGVKADTHPSRLQRLELVVDIAGDFDPLQKATIVQRAEQACTIANTLRTPVLVSARLADPALTETVA